jgi:hypothetical protein
MSRAIFHTHRRWDIRRWDIVSGNQLNQVVEIPFLPFRYRWTRDVLNLGSLRVGRRLPKEVIQRFDA